MCAILDLVAIVDAQGMLSEERARLELRSTSALKVIRWCSNTIRDDLCLCLHLYNQSILDGNSHNQH